MTHCFTTEGRGSEGFASVDRRENKVVIDAPLESYYDYLRKIDGLILLGKKIREFNTSAESEYLKSSYYCL